MSIDLRKVIFCGFLMLVPLQVPAENVSVFFLGVGNAKCGSYVKEYHDQESIARYQFRAWVTGFISGMNAKEGGNVGSTMVRDVDSIEQYVLKHCEDNPLSDVNEASYKLYVYLKKRNM